MAFLSRREVLIELIGYVTKTPADPDNRNESYKYPFLASQVLVNCGNKIAEAIVQGGTIEAPAKSLEDDEAIEIGGPIK